MYLIAFALLPFASTAVYYLIIKSLTAGYETRVGYRVSWGITEYYGYYVFFLISTILTFLSFVKPKVYRLSLALAAFSLIVLYWVKALAIHPYRSSVMVGAAFIIYVSAYFLGLRLVAIYRKQLYRS